MSVHLLTAWLAVAAITVVGIVSVVDAVTRRRRFLEDRLILVVLASVLAAVATGAVAALGGSGPRDPLHLLYAAAIVAALPVARFIGRSISDRRRDVVLLVGSLLAAGLLVRLAQTG